MTAHHPPIAASNGNAFVIAELTRGSIVTMRSKSRGVSKDFDAHPHFGVAFPFMSHGRDGQIPRIRMFSPFWDGVSATGSANTPLACLLSAIEPNVQQAEFEIHQGVEMERPSLLQVNARRTPEE